MSLSPSGSAPGFSILASRLTCKNSFRNWVTGSKVVTISDENALVCIQPFRRIVISLHDKEDIPPGGIEQQTCNFERSLWPTVELHFLQTAILKTLLIGLVWFLNSEKDYRRDLDRNFQVNYVNSIDEDLLTPNATFFKRTYHSIWILRIRIDIKKF